MVNVRRSGVCNQTVLEEEGVPATGLGQRPPDWRPDLRALLFKRRSWPDRFLLSAKELIERVRWYREDGKAVDELESRLRLLNSGSQRDTAVHSAQGDAREVKKSLLR